MRSRSASAQRYSGSLALSVMGLAMGLAANAISAPDSPVQLFASVNRAQFTPTEWDVLVEHYDYVSGLSAGGYDFPGAIQAFRNANTTTPVLTYLELCGIHAANIVDDRYDQYDRVEDVFFHTTDPASLRVFPGPGGTRVTWVQDSRERSNSTYTAPGVAGYIVRIAPTLDGPWLDAAPAVSPTSDFYYNQTIPHIAPGCWIRVVSRLLDNTVVDYSWPAQVEDATTVITHGRMALPTFDVIVEGPGAPVDPADVVLEVDLDLDRVWGEPGERSPASTRAKRGPNRWIYTGNVPWPVDRQHYRFVLASDPSTSAPPGNESYTISRRNNRVQTRFGAFIVRPGHPLTQSIQTQRLRDALDTGYDGASLDFAYDDISPTWITAGDVAPRELAEVNDLPNAVADLIGLLRADQPEARLVFNGFFVVEDSGNFYDYLENASGAHFEFFAFGGQPGATVPNAASASAVANIIETSHAGNRMSVAISSEGANNVTARLSALTLYLLAANENVYFSYTSGDHQSVDWYPEWRVPLGTPVIPAFTNVDELAHPDSASLSRRVFSHGLVLFNWAESESIKISLGQEYHLLTTTGGLDPILGGDGRAIYRPVPHLTLAPRTGAILVTEPPPPCPADLDADGSVGFAELASVLAAWGVCAGCPEDFDESEHVGFVDLSHLLNQWGACEIVCEADLDGSGSIGFGDLTIMLNAWGPAPVSSAANLNSDASVGFGDLTTLLNAWGPCE